MFLIDMKGLTQAVKVFGRGGLAIGGVGEVLDLARESFDVDETEGEAEQQRDNLKLFDQFTVTFIQL